MKRVIALKLRELEKSLRIELASAFSKKPWLSIFYYCVFSRSFCRECQAVLQGKVRYHESLKGDNQYLLKRNIHRLEKGLVMKPFRNLFAIDYIKETVTGYEKYIHHFKEYRDSQDEAIWYFSVLSKYFEVVSSHPAIDEAKEIFYTIPSIENTIPLVPYRRRDNQLSVVSYKDFMSLCKQRRSVRWYLQKAVPRSLIDQAMSAALLSPSACNRQPFEFRVFDDPLLIRQIGAMPRGTNGFHQNFPAVVVVIGKLSAYFDERDRHVIYIDAALAAMSFMYALETLGLSSCPINWPDIEVLEKEMTDLLNLELAERVVMLISIGFPDPEGLIPYSQKKSLDQIIKYNKL
ncbi:MAG: nitroreductase family protein [Cyanobacteria bacterium J06635_10]